MKLGLEKSRKQLCRSSKHLHKCSDLTDHCYYGMCLTIGIETKKKTEEGMKIVRLASVHFPTAKYFFSILCHLVDCYSLF
jgi:hypothetical protein